MSALLAAACARAAPTPTPPGPTTPAQELAQLAALAASALQRARTAAADAVLRQVDVGADGRHIFRFTDGAATEEITVIAHDPRAPASSWAVVRGVSPLSGRVVPALQLSALRVSPSAVTAAATSHWRSCTTPVITLTGQGEALTWHVFCSTPEGVVSGTMDNATASFTPSAAPPARSPPTATPEPTPSGAPAPAAASPTATATIPTSTATPTASPPPTPAPSATPSPRPTSTPTVPTVSIGPAIISVELAVTPREQEQGLSGRAGLPSGGGMIFIYEGEGIYGFWMKDMRFALDFVWIRADCTVLEVTPNVPPPAPDTPTNRLPIYTPSQPIRYMIEIVGGDAARRGISPGARARFSGKALDPYPCS